MLYISRRIGYRLYGVVDTDDNVEQTVDRQEIWRVYSKVPIRGCVVKNGALKDVVPYQSDIYRTAHRDRVQILGNVDVTLWRNMITNISFDPEKISLPVSIRLSDFGQDCAAGILMGCPYCQIPKLTIVVDDFVKFDEATFKAHDMRVRIDMSGIKFDLREVSSFEAAALIYDAVSVCTSDMFGMSNAIIDKPERLNLWLRRSGFVVF